MAIICWRQVMGCFRVLWGIGMMYFFIVCSMLLQLTAAVLALRLIPETGRRWSWILLSLGLAGMVLRRAHVLILMLSTGYTPDLVYELIGLAVSLAVFMGIALIRPLFRKLKEANEKLVESELRFRTMADFTHDWEYWRGPDGNFVYMSPSCEQITGYAQSEFMASSKLLERIVHPEDKERVVNHIAAEPQNKAVGELDYRIIACDGSIHWIAHCCTPVFGLQNEYLGVRASNRDITPRKQVEARLEQSRRLYHDLVEQAQSIILELNLAGEVVFINGFAQKFFGYNARELQGVRAIGTLLPETYAEMDNFLPKGRKPIFDESEARRKNGATAWISWARSVITDESGKPKGILCVGMDNTERKAAEKLKEDVERIVRHDLKSPLMGIIGLPRLMLHEDNLTDEQKEMLTAMQESGQQMLQLVNQSLNLYKLETGGYDYHPRAVDLLEIVRRVVRELRSRFSVCSEFEVVFNGKPAADSDQMFLPGDETLLYGMAANLIKNALEASGEESVVVSLQIADPCIMEIHNQLPVPDQVRDIFFDKYATQGKNDGTGLGTYSALLAVKAHGGTITMRSSAAAGTVVRVELPCSH